VKFSKSSTSGFGIFIGTFVNFLGISVSILQHCEIAHFHIHVDGKTDQVLMKIVSQMYFQTTTSPLEFGSHRDPDLESLWICTRFALAEICTIRVFLLSLVLLICVDYGDIVARMLLEPFTQLE